MELFPEFQGGELFSDGRLGHTYMRGSANDRRGHPECGLTGGDEGGDADSLPLDVTLYILGRPVSEVRDESQRSVEPKA